MVRLNYALVGGLRGVYTAQLNANESVDGFKTAVKANHPHRITCESQELLLYSAKNDSEWLQIDAVDSVSLDEHGNLLCFAAVDSLPCISDDETSFHDIHVLVVVPTDYNRVAKRSNVQEQQVPRGHPSENGFWKDQIKEAPDMWMSSLLEERVEHLPLDRIGLQHHLERELRVKIPITTRLARLVSLSDTAGECDDTMLRLFEPCEACTFETGAIVGSVVEPLERGFGNKVEGAFKYRLLWDSLISTVLLRVARGRLRRNTPDSSFSDFCRPNLCFYSDFSLACVFRGEEESSGDMRVPLRRLHEHLIWRYGDAPYVFGYAAVGYKVSLVVIRPHSTSSHGAKVEEIDRYDLDKRHGRLSFFLALLNLSTLFLPVAQLIPPLGVQDYGDVEQDNGVKLSFGQDSVVKEYPATMQSDRTIKNLERLHGLMNEHVVPNVVTLMETDHNTRKVLLSPLGYVARPANLKQLVTALRGVLTALVALHKLNVMHRDVRWDNVIKYLGDRDEWFLIDFDDAAMSPATEGVTQMHSKSHAPEIAGPHGLEVDIWSVGYLLESSRLHLPHQLDTMREQCLQVRPSKRPSAAMLLKTMQRLLKTFE